MAAGLEGVLAAAIAMLALGATAEAPVRGVASAPSVQLAQSAPIADPARPAPPPGSPAAPTAVEEAVKEAFAGIVVHDDGTVESVEGKGLATEDGLPPGLAREVRTSNRLPRAVQDRLTAQIKARYPEAEVEYNGVEVIVLEKSGGKEIESIKDVIELARVMSRPPPP